MKLQLVEGMGSAARSPVRPVVLCGGSGSRLWPISRSLHPKQLLAVAGTETMLQATVARISGPLFDAPLVVAGEDHRFLVKDQLAAVDVEPANLILEPAPRNTAPAIAAAANWLRAEGDPEQIMLVVPSDHLISDVPAFLAAVAEALPVAEAGLLVTFGIEPRLPETGYGYMEAGLPLEYAPHVRSVSRFSEKPNLETAKDYCASGRHFWNAGIFLFRADVFLSELDALAPEVAAACELAAAEGIADGDFFRPGPSFLSSPSISIDCAVMERTRRAAVVPVSMGWSDVGSWHALWEVQAQDERQNVLHGDVLAMDCRGSLLRSEDGITIAALGADNMIVVATRDAVLVIPREKAQHTKLLVDQLRANGNVFRERFQTKRIA